MSIVTGRHDLRIVIDDDDVQGEFPGYGPQLSQRFTLSKGELSIDYVPHLACGWSSARYQGHEMLQSTGHGQGNEVALVLGTTQLTGANYWPILGLIYAPTESGRSTDGGSVYVGSSHNLFVGVSDDQTSCVRLIKAAHWGDPDKVLHPVPLSTRTLSEFVLEIYDTLGYAGDDQIVHRKVIVHVPDLPELAIQKYSLMCPMTHYMKSETFRVTKAVEPTTGELTEVFPTDGNVLMYSQSTPYLWSTPDGRFSCATYAPPSRILPYGFFGTRFSTRNGHANTFLHYGPPKWPHGIPPVKLELDAWWPFGTEAEVADKIRFLHELHP